MGVVVLRNGLGGVEPPHVELLHAPPAADVDERLPVRCLGQRRV
jgi:hypothetical protein